MRIKDGERKEEGFILNLEGIKAIKRGSTGR